MSATAPERAKEIQFDIFILLITGMGTGAMWVRGFLLRDSDYPSFIQLPVALSRNAQEEKT